MKITFIRHGFAEHNQGFLDQGESAYSSLLFRGSRLTQLGHTQTLNAIVPDVEAVYVSPLIRCIETARNIFGYAEVFYLSDGLLETQGPYPCNWREPKALIDIKYRNVDTHLVSPNYTLHPEPETKRHLAERAEQTLLYILSKSKKMKAKSVAVVTHNDWLAAIFGRKFNNGEVYTIEIA